VAQAATFLCLLLQPRECQRLRQLQKLQPMADKPLHQPFRYNKIKPR
jgi:hypothetical protein